MKINITYALNFSKSVITVHSQWFYDLAVMLVYLIVHRYLFSQHQNVFMITIV